MDTNGLPEEGDILRVAAKEREIEQVGGVEESTFSHMGVVCRHLSAGGWLTS